MKRTLRILFVAALILSSCSKAELDLKIISFNIRYNSWNNIDDANGWPFRKEAVVNMILQEHPDAIGLQEALVDQLLYLDSSLPTYRRVGVGRDDGNEGGEFMAIYYDTTRLENLGYNTYWLSETPEVPSLGWDAACSRTVTTLKLRDRHSGKEFVYLNTHLDHVGMVARAESAKLIASTIKDFPTDLPVILGGDMNSTIDDTIFNTFYANGLQSAKELSGSESNDITYNAFGKGEGSAIDHFFVRNAKVSTYNTLTADYGAPYISDHYPIAITILL